MDMLQHGRRNAPTIGFVMATIAQEFDKSLKEKVRGRYRSLFELFKSSGAISERSIFFEEFESEGSIAMACEGMTDARVDGIIFHPLTWPAGEAISALAMYRYLVDIPIMISASPEIFPERETAPHPWPQNSDCGRIYASSVMKKLGRRVMQCTGLPEEQEYQDTLLRFFAACQLVCRAKLAKVAVVGNIMDDFAESFYSPTAIRRGTGIRVCEIDSSVLFTLYETGRYERRHLAIDELEIPRIIESLTCGANVRVEPKTLQDATRLYLAYREIIRSVNAESAVFRCGPELQEKYGLVACGVSAQLVDNGVIASAGCEGDVHSAVTGLLQFYASGCPTTCMDWVDRPGAMGKGCYTVMHCGNACKTMVQDGQCVLDYHQAWTWAPLGYTIEGPLKKGPVTVARLRQNNAGDLELLVAEGESVAERMEIRGNFGIIDFGESRLRSLAQEITEKAWPHHVSVGWGHHAQVLADACHFLGTIRVVRI
jgi:L-fucose isomerase-like protein